jgi:hypothetical protein
LGFLGRRGLVSLGLLRFLLRCFCDDSFALSIMFFVSMMISSVAGITISRMKSIGVLMK